MQMISDSIFLRCDRITKILDAVVLGIANQNSTINTSADSSGEIHVNWIYAFSSPGSYYLSQGIEYDDPGKFRIAGIDETICSDCKVWFIVQGLSIPAFHIPFIEKILGYTIAIWRKDLNPLIPCIRNIEIACLVQRQSGRFIKLPIGKSNFTELGDKYSLEVKNRNAFIASIGNIDMSVLIYGNISRPPERFWCFPLSEMPPASQESSLSVEFLDTVIPGIGYENISFRTDRNTPGFIKTSCRGVSFLSRTKLTPAVEQL